MISMIKTYKQMIPSYIFEKFDILMTNLLINIYNLQMSKFENKNRKQKHFISGFVFVPCFCKKILFLLFLFFTKTQKTKTV